MKNVIYTLAILASIFTSCTGDIEDDISALEENLIALQAENDALQTELDGVSNNLDEVSNNLDGVSNNLTDGGLDVTSPTKANHEYTTDGATTSETVTFLSSNGFYAKYNSYNAYKTLEAISVSPIYTHIIYMNFNSVDGNQMTLELYYNSETEEVTLDSFRFDNHPDYYYINNSQIGSEHIIKVNSFNIETGEISLDFSMEYNSNFNDSDYDSGKLNFSFNDILKESGSSK